MERDEIDYGDQPDRLSVLQVAAERACAGDWRVDEAYLNLLYPETVTELVRLAGLGAAVETEVKWSGLAAFAGGSAGEIKLVGRGHWPEGPRPAPEEIAADLEQAGHPL